LSVLVADIVIFPFAEGANGARPSCHIRFEAGRRATVISIGRSGMGDWALPVARHDPVN
jgi:hypothetical protein